MNFLFILFPSSFLLFFFFFLLSSVFSLFFFIVSSIVQSLQKPKKKNKGRTISLVEFSAFGGPKPVQSEPVGLTHEDRLVLPTGTHERTVEELARDRIGGRFKGYDRGPREDSRSKWGKERREREMEEREIEMHRRRRMSLIAGFRVRLLRLRRGRFGGGSGGGFERERKVGFKNGDGEDSDTWGRKKMRVMGKGLRERERKVGLGSNSNGGGADSDSWGRKREESKAFAPTWGEKKADLQTYSLFLYYYLSGVVFLTLMSVTPDFGTSQNGERKSVTPDFTGCQKARTELPPKGTNHTAWISEL